MSQNFVTSAVSIFIIFFVPVALFGLLLPVNEYRDQGISGAVDCDGPLNVLLFAVPSVMIYAGCILRNEVKKDDEYSLGSCS